MNEDKVLWEGQVFDWAMGRPTQSRIVSHGSGDSILLLWSVEGERWTSPTELETVLAAYRIAFHELARRLNLAVRMTQPLHDRVLVRIDPVSTDEEKSAGGIIMVRTSESDQNPVRKAVVLKVGTGEILYNGEIRALAVKEGDEVLVHENEVLPLRPTVDPLEPIEGIVSERSILAIL